MPTCSVSLRGDWVSWCEGAPRCHARTEAPPHSCRSLSSGCSGEERRAGADMKQRLWFSLALIAVLFCFWLLMTKPMCRDGFVATFGARSGWTCVAGVN